MHTFRRAIQFRSARKKKRKAETLPFSPEDQLHHQVTPIQDNAGRAQDCTEEQVAAVAALHAAECRKYWEWKVAGDCDSGWGVWWLTADYVFQFRICRLHYVLRLSDSFSAAFLVVRALPFLISHCLSLCTALCVCVFVSVTGHERVCNGALTTAKLLPSFLAFLLVSLVRSLFSAF